MPPQAALKRQEAEKVAAQLRLEELKRKRCVCVCGPTPACIIILAVFDLMLNPPAAIPTPLKRHFETILTPL
jgi:hypothetical protein